MLLLSPAQAAHGQKFEELVKSLPGKANTLVLLNVDKILFSPVAIRENWKTKHEETYAAGLSMLPPDVKQAVFASELDLSEMSPEWESVVMRIDDEADLPDLARSSGGRLEFIDNHKAVALPTNAYAVQFSGNIVGAMTPTNRQSVGRWIRETDSRVHPDLSPYLTEAFGYANGLGTPIILAIDLQDVATSEDDLALLKASDNFANQTDAELQRLAKVLAGIRGLTLGVTLGEKPFGKVKVDFADELGISPELAKAMLLRALAKRGAMLKELSDWTPQVNGRQVSLEGELTSSGTKRLFSLFDRAPSFMKPPAETGTTTPLPPPPSDDRPKLYATKAYFNKATDYLRDLRSNSYDASTFGSIAMWYDSYARKIDQLPVVGVDPEVLAYSRRTANAMRQASSLIKSANYQKGVRQANVQPQYVTNTWGMTYGYSYGWDGYGGPVGSYSTYTSRDYAAENDAKTTIRREETANAGLSSQQIMHQIEEDTASTRQRMSLKYNENF